MKTIYLALTLVLFSCAQQPDRSKMATPSTSDINKFIDEWHHAAATANSEVFFGSMADSSIYIGTDATERWTKQEFMTFADPYFKRGKAWDFKPYERQLHVSSDGQYVWFSELLTTWMGICRGSGIVKNTGEGFKIEHYHLSVTVPNDAIQDFIKLVDNFNQQKK
jgi:hypothetical protein